jgi:PmbA protein
MERAAGFVLDKCRQLGATSADVTIVSKSGIELKGRHGKFETVDAGLESDKVIVRAFVGHSSGSFEALSLTPAVLLDAVRRAVNYAQAKVRLSPVDECDGLPLPEQMATNMPQAAPLCPQLAALTPEQMIEMAIEAEAAAFEDPRVVSGEGAGMAGCGKERKEILYANSHGFMGRLSRQAMQLYVEAIARDGDDRQSNYGWDTKPRLHQLDSPAVVGRMAAQRATRLLNGKKIETAPMPVVFDPMTATLLLSQFIGAASGNAIYRKSSYLCDRIDEQVAASIVSITDDPFMEDGLGFSPFGDDGLAIAQRDIVVDGILRQYVLGTYAARKLGLDPNGGSKTNLFMHAGTTPLSDMIGSVERGLFVVGVNGHGPNNVNGDYSQAAEALLIENGQLTDQAVTGITIASKMLDIFRGIKMVGDRLEFRPMSFSSSTAAPPFLVESMTVGGK